MYSDSDSDWSSPENRPGGGGSQGSGDTAGSRPPRKSSSHKRPRRKRAAIPVATPRVPPLPSALHQALPPGVPLPLSARPRGDLSSSADKGIRHENSEGIIIAFIFFIVKQGNYAIRTLLCPTRNPASTCHLLEPVMLGRRW